MPPVTSVPSFLRILRKITLPILWGGLALLSASASAQCTLNTTNPSVTICTPTAGSTVTSPVHVVAGTTSTTYPVTAIWVYLDYNVVYKAPAGATSIDTFISMSAATHRLRVQAWNSSGQVFYQEIFITVSSTSGPVASLSPTSLSFGTVAVGGTSAPQNVTLKNTGTSTLNITSIATSGDFAQTNVCGSSLSVGGSCTISVTFTPTTTGTRGGTLSISDDAPGSPQTVSLTGTGGSSTTCTASTVNPSVTICTPAAGSTVTSPVHVVALTTSTTYPVTAIWVYLDYNVVYKSAAGAKSIDTYITMTAATHRLRVQAWNSAGQVFWQEIFITVSSTSGPVAQLSPTNLNFGTVTVGQSSSPQTVTLSNTGNQALSITSIGASGDFTQSNTCGSSVAAGASCAISVVFTPSTTGTRTGTLSVADNAAGSPQTVSLTGTGGSSSGPIPINHIIFMLQENRSFDQYFSNLNNYRAALGYSTEVDVASPTATQPQDSGTYISRFHMRTMCIEELSPNWLESHGDANRWNPSSDNILMDGFVHTAQGIANYYGFWDKGGYRAMGYYTEADLPYYYFMATQFATSDRWFSPVPTNSTVNRLYGFAATSAGHVHDESYTLSNKTIFQALAETGHTWKIYYTDTDSSGVPASRIWRFQPFANDNTANIVPMSQYFTDVQNGTLPDFAFIETGFLSGRDEHPGGTVSGNPYTGSQVQRGAAYAASIVNALMTSPSWTDSAFILSWDEVGGPYDHVPPDLNVPNPDGIPPLDLYSSDPAGDFTRTGFRVPLLVVSPWTKPHYVSHTTMDYTAVLKLVEARFGLSPLTARDAAMPDMTEFFDFVNKPWATPPTPPSQPTTGECNYTDLP